MRGISWLADEMLASREGLYPMELVCQLYFLVVNCIIFCMKCEYSSFCYKRRMKCQYDYESKCFEEFKVVWSTNRWVVATDQTASPGSTVSFPVFQDPAAALPRTMELDSDLCRLTGRPTFHNLGSWKRCLVNRTARMQDADRNYVLQLHFLEVGSSRRSQHDTTYWHRLSVIIFLIIEVITSRYTTRFDLYLVVFRYLVFCNVGDMFRHVPCHLQLLRTPKFDTYCPNFVVFSKLCIIGGGCSVAAPQKWIFRYCGLCRCIAGREFLDVLKNRVAFTFRISQYNYYYYYYYYNYNK
jgi:hypothetical protein